MQVMPSPELTSRVPIALIAGRRETSVIAADLEALLGAAGRLSKPGGGVLVAAASPGQIVRRGLRVDRCSVAAIADSAAPADPESFRRGIDAVLKATSGFVVIDADNAAAVAATRPVDRARLVLCAPRENEAVRQHAALGGPVVVRIARNGGEHIELRSAGTVLACASVSSIRSQARGRLGRRIRARMFTVALAFGLGLSSQQIATAAERRDRNAVVIGYERVTAVRATRRAGVTRLGRPCEAAP